MKKVLDFLKANIRIIVIAVILLVFIIVYKSKDVFTHKTIYTVVNGDLESMTETNLYLLKSENIVDYNKEESITAIVDQGKRASKYEAIATYQNESYADYQNQIAQIDKQIQSLIKDMPETHSADITSIENKILKYASELQGTTSYSKIQEYKAKLDELAYKKITILANSSPEDSAIRDLISQREELVRLSKTSENTIWTDRSGIVTYKLDGLEGILDYGNITNYSAQDLDNIIEKYNTNGNNEFGIKIVNNFNAYLLVKTPKGENDEYIKEGRTYNIRVADLENTTLKVRLTKNIAEGDYNYSIFEIQNEIDSLVDYRKLSCEVIWNTISGMAVPLNAIYHDDEQNYDYVLMVYGTDYKRVAVNIKRKSDSIAIVENVDKNTAESYGLDTSFVLEMYDELVIEDR
jgi:putative membrane fusion protein